MAETGAFYHLFPEARSVETSVVDARPGMVRLEILPFYPGGGGQLADRGTLRSQKGVFPIAGMEVVDGAIWVRLADEAVLLDGVLEAAVDTGFRQEMRELHTGTHLLNALVFSAFDGALVTGAQLGADGSARLDFDLPGADNDTIRALEGPLNDLIVQDLPVHTHLLSMDEVLAEPGLVRSKSVAPPPGPDGLIRIVEVVGLDRQACGGTHLSSTGASRRLRIQKVENKGRHNRRVRIAFD